ncbi:MULTISPECIES: hypothetical protein [unclassified Sphingomonas]|uniref:hypothetical protein n=1 Tax=unclassified Sphingomonas TaxID=196159 RepID=UPI0022B4E528|nr:hypothetical protein [Sphingomonas sp. NIBR02145]WHU05281.1 hypothetical protein O3305_07950 [Sphingomonas sp. NIBR02145]
MKPIIALALALPLAMPGVAHAATAERKALGTLSDGRAVEAITLPNAHGIALAPQLFPDTPNPPAFGSARLDPGQTYRNPILYRFSTPAPSGRD